MIVSNLPINLNSNSANINRASRLIDNNSYKNKAVREYKSNFGLYDAGLISKINFKGATPSIVNITKDAELKLLPYKQAMEEAVELIKSENATPENKALFTACRDFDALVKRQTKQIQAEVQKFDYYSEIRQKIRSAEKRYKDVCIKFGVEPYENFSEFDENGRLYEFDGEWYKEYDATSHDNDFAIRFDDSNNGAQYRTIKTLKFREKGVNYRISVGDNGYKEYTVYDNSTKDSCETERTYKLRYDQIEKCIYRQYTSLADMAKTKQCKSVDITFEFDKNKEVEKTFYGFAQGSHNYCRMYTDAGERSPRRGEADSSVKYVFYNDNNYSTIRLNEHNSFCNYYDEKGKIDKIGFIRDFWHDMHDRLKRTFVFSSQNES